MSGYWPGLPAKEARMFVGEFCTRSPVTIGPTADLVEAAQTMREQHVARVQEALNEFTGLSLDAH